MFNHTLPKTRTTPLPLAHLSVPRPPRPTASESRRMPGGDRFPGSSPVGGPWLRGKPFRHRVVLHQAYAGREDRGEDQHLRQRPTAGAAPRSPVFTVVPGSSCSEQMQFTEATFESFHLWATQRQFFIPKKGLTAEHPRRCERHQPTECALPGLCQMPSRFGRRRTAVPGFWRWREMAIFGVSNIWELVQQH